MFHIRIPGLTQFSFLLRWTLLINRWQLSYLDICRLCGKPGIVLGSSFHPSLTIACTCGMHPQCEGEFSLSSLLSGSQIVIKRFFETKYFLTNCGVNRSCFNSSSSSVKFTWETEFIHLPGNKEMCQTSWVRKWNKILHYWSIVIS